jgi:5-methylcytosine-specific restriction endonuclease McrA
MKKRKYSRGVEAKFRRAMRKRQRIIESGRSLFHILGYTAWARVRERLAEAANWTCAYCSGIVRLKPSTMTGTDLATIEHKQPTSKGGTSKRFNLACACKGCNNDKGNMTEEEYRAVIAAGYAWFAGRAISRADLQRETTNA